MDKGSRLGAEYLGSSRCRFTVWAPLAEKVEVHILSPEERIRSLVKDNLGYHQGVIDGIEPGANYFYRLDSVVERPDPASRYQPEDVHGPSKVIDPAPFIWQDENWSGLPLEQYIIYELHTGTYTEGGTFDAIIPHLDKLKELGITALEIMPVAQFPGNRNWGYDGVYLFAVQDSYGGPDGLKRLINACHQNEMTVVLDVVYNHFGPEGNYITDFGPYFTDRYHTPWGAVINFDGHQSDEVRRFFIENALYWLNEFHVDALRLDALHAILDATSHLFIEELAEAFHNQAENLGRKAYLIGESSDNNPRLIKPTELGGYGLDAQWNDDFHHSLHAILTGERNGYYQDFGQLQQLAKAFREGFVYTGQHSLYRQRRHGASSRDVPAHHFVVFSRNHDQVGNRINSERLSQVVSFEALKLAAGLVLLSPFVPLLFMGEEYGETAPFPYFISHSQWKLVEAVRKGRSREFAAFQWEGEAPDPYDENTFLSAKLNHDLCLSGHHKTLLEFYKALIRLRKETPALALLSKGNQRVNDYPESNILYLHRWDNNSQSVIAFNIDGENASAVLPFPDGKWRKELDSSEEIWGGEGSLIPHEINSNEGVSLEIRPWSFVLFLKET